MSDPTLPEPAPSKCFVIMPFTKTEHSKGSTPVSIEENQWTHIYKEWIKKAVETFPDRKLICKRSAAIPGNFVKGIVQDLSDSDFVIAELTGNRPNVYYELGIRNALRTGTIMITQDLKALPADLQTYYCFQYAYTEKAHEYDAAFASFEAELHDKLRAIVLANFPSDNPVSDYVGFSRYQHRQDFHRAKNHLIVALTYFYEIALYTEQFFLTERDKAMTDYDAIENLARTTNKELLSAAVARLRFDFDRTMFPQALASRLDAILTSAFPHMLRMCEIAKRYDTRTGALNNWEIRLGLEALNTKQIREVRTDLTELQEPVSP